MSTPTGAPAGPQEFFSPLAFDFLWESLHIGELPYPLRVPSHGATMDERLHLRHRVDTELRARGIRDAHGRAEPRIEDAFALLAGAPISVDSLFLPEFQAAPVGVLAASDGKDAVLAVQDVNGIWIRPVFPDGLATAVVDLLPPGPRGTEQSVTMPLEEARRTAPAQPVVGGARGRTAEEDPRRGRRARRSSLADKVAADPREGYALLAAQPRRRGGQLGANSRDQVGGKRRSPVLAWFDTATGRYLSLSQPGADGSPWVTISPADHKTLRSRLAELISAIQ